MNIVILISVIVLALFAVDAVGKGRYLLGVLEILGSLYFLTYEFSHVM